MKSYKMANRGSKQGMTENNKELEVLKMYLEEIKMVSPVQEGEKEKLLKEYQEGKKEVRNRLMELYLMDTLQIASAYKGQGIGLSDLIQEANMGLLYALEDGEIEDIQIKSRIKQAVEDALFMEGKEGAVGEQITKEINRLDEASKFLTERNGEAPSIEELTKYLGIPEQELREYMKTSLDAVNVGVQK